MKLSTFLFLGKQKETSPFSCLFHVITPPLGKDYYLHSCLNNLELSGFPAPVFFSSWEGTKSPSNCLIMVWKVTKQKKE